MSVQAPDRTLATAIAEANRNATVLDDPGELEDAAVYRWLAGHQLHRDTYRRLVIHYQPLPAAWQTKRKSFVSLHDAEVFLRRFAGDRSAMRTLRAICNQLTPQGPSLDKDVLKLLAGYLLSRRVWAVETKWLPFRFVSKTSPSAFAPINPALGTSVDFAYIAELEGDQWLRGYVPPFGGSHQEAGIVAGRSGMTVASGFDVGQWSAAQIDKMGFPPALVAKIRPFADLPFKGKTKAQVAATVAKVAPVPLLTKDEADLCDRVVFTTILKDAMRSWNARAAKGVPTFTALPAGWQTVWLSRFYNEGPGPKSPSAISFRNLAREGRYAEAVSAMRGYTGKPGVVARARKEADLLDVVMPPPLPKPPAPGVKP